MEIQRTDVGLVTVLRLKGDVDSEGVDVLRLALLRCIKEKRFNVVVNLSVVGYVSYLGIGVLLERMRQMRASGGDLRLASPNVPAVRALHMACVTRMFGIFESEALAIEGFRAAA